eukprot:m.1373892 g.1373892  ORF g.1373892 m.1373892 type:complete len:54 (+) comp24958_c0_seq6:73-234(+)
MYTRVIASRPPGACFVCTSIRAEDSRKGKILMDVQNEDGSVHDARGLDLSAGS